MVFALRENWRYLLGLIVACVLIFVAILLSAPAAKAGWLQSNLGSGAPDGVRFAWCGYAMRLQMQSKGLGDPGPAFNAVSSWYRYGSAGTGAVGDIYVTGGHVSEVASHDCPAGSVPTISGNATGRKVSLMCERRGGVFRSPGIGLWIDLAVGLPVADKRTRRNDQFRGANSPVSVDPNPDAISTR